MINLGFSSGWGIVVGAAALAACATQNFREGGEGEGEGEQVDCGDSTSGTVECGDGAAQVCRDGTWIPLNCAGGCADGRCGENQCADGEAIACGPDGTLRRCDPAIGGWEIDYCPALETCVDGGCQPAVCSPTLRFCGTGGESNVVFECNDKGSEFAAVETCGGGDVCSGGACLSACEQAATSYSFIGCRYYALDTDNDSYNDGLQFDVVVANPQAAPASVTVSERTDGGWTALTTVTVEPQGVRIIPTTCSGGGFGGSCASGNLRSDRHPEDTVLAPRYAFLVESSVPIVAYQFNSDDMDGSASSSGATILMPEAALDVQYYALTLPQRTADRAWVAVVAMEDATSVTIRASAATAAGGGIAALAAGDSMTQSLDDGDVLQLSSGGNGEDLSGTYVLADKPVAVFSGTECGTTTNDYLCDHTEEEMMPVVTWGKSFVAARVRHPQQDYGSTSGAVWKLVAAQDDTTVTFDAGPDVGGLPSGPVALQAGDIAAFQTSGANGHFAIEATKGIQVVQFMPGEVVAIVVVPTEQYLPEYVFLAPPFFQDTLTTSRPIGTPILLDGASIGGGWMAAGGSYEVNWKDTLDDGTHKLSIDGGGLKGGNAGIQLIGMDVNCSYGYLGGLNAERINILQ